MSFEQTSRDHVVVVIINFVSFLLADAIFKFEFVNATHFSLKMAKNEPSTKKTGDGHSILLRAKTKKGIKTAEMEIMEIF